MERLFLQNAPPDKKVHIISRFEFTPTGVEWIYAEFETHESSLEAFNMGFYGTVAELRERLQKENSGFVDIIECNKNETPWFFPN